LPGSAGPKSVETSIVNYLRTIARDAKVEDGTGACIALCRRLSAQTPVASERPLDDLVWAGSAGKGQTTH